MWNVGFYVSRGMPLIVKIGARVGWTFAMCVRYDRCQWMLNVEEELPKTKTNNQLNWETHTHTPDEQIISDH